MMRNHVGTLLQQLNAYGGNRSRSSAFSALPQGLSGGLGLREFAMFSQLQGLAAFNNPQQSIFSPEGLQLLTQQQQRQAQQLTQGCCSIPHGNQAQQQQLHLGLSSLMETLVEARARVGTQRPPQLMSAGARLLDKGASRNQ